MAETRQDIYFTLLKETDPNNAFPDDLPSLIVHLSDLLKEVPAEFHENIRVNFSSEGGYEGCHSPTVEITWSRPETDEEMKERILQFNKRKECERQYEELQEKNMYLRLKNKYGDK